jgi:dTDP-4-amino-4,6-dideoxygalactose transaminase
MKKIEFGELKINSIARQHVIDCLDTNWASMGPKTKLLEEKFAALMGTKYAVATSSGTASLTAMTLALPEIARKKVIKGKSKVICPALAFIANSTAVVSGGLIPKWVDIKSDTLNIDEELVEKEIDDDVVAIYAVGTMGRPSEMSILKDIADRYGLVLFEDSCENYGSKINNQFSHKYAIGGCSSFFQAHLVQAGEGSCIYTDDEKLKDLLISIRSHGRHPNSAFFDHIRFGSNFKTTDMCASLALGAIDEFHTNIEQRKYIWRELVTFSKQYEDIAWFSDEPSHMEVMPHGFSITLKPKSNKSCRDLEKIMDKYNIHWKRNFGFCGHHNSLNYLNSGDSDNKYKNAIWCGNNGIHIGTHRYMTSENIERIKTAMKEFFQ